MGIQTDVNKLGNKSWRNELRLLTSLPLLTRAGAGAGHGGQGGQSGHVALAALSRPEAQTRLTALEGLGAAVSEQAVPAPSVAVKDCQIMSDNLTMTSVVSPHLTFLWAALWLLSLRVRLSERLVAVWAAEADLEPMWSLRFLRISESRWVIVGCLAAWGWCLLSWTSITSPSHCSWSLQTVCCICCPLSLKSLESTHIDSTPFSFLMQSYC